MTDTCSYTPVGGDSYIQHTDGHCLVITARSSALIFVHLYLPFPLVKNYTIGTEMRERSRLR